MNLRESAKEIEVTQRGGCLEFCLFHLYNVVITCTVLYKPLGIRRDMRETLPLRNTGKYDCDFTTSLVRVIAFKVNNMVKNWNSREFYHLDPAYMLYFCHVVYFV